MQTYLVIAAGLTGVLAAIYVIVGWNDKELKSVPLYWVGGTVLLMGVVWPLTIIWMVHAFVTEAWKKKGKR